MSSKELAMALRVTMTLDRTELETLAAFIQTLTAPIQGTTEGVKDKPSYPATTSEILTGIFGPVGEDKES